MNRFYTVTILILSVTLLICSVSLNVLSDQVEPIEEHFEPILLEPITMKVPVKDLSDIKFTSLGEYTITAYCGCKKCCGKWSTDKPKTASGEYAEANKTIASPLPFGTTVYIDGLGVYTVQDRTSKYIEKKYNKKIIDVYFDTHEEALKFGKTIKNVIQVEVK